MPKILNMAAQRAKRAVIGAWDAEQAANFRANLLVLEDWRRQALETLAEIDVKIVEVKRWIRESEKGTR